MKINLLKNSHKKFIIKKIIKPKKQDRKQPSIKVRKRTKTNNKFVKPMEYEIIHNEAT